MGRVSFKAKIAIFLAPFALALVGIGVLSLTTGEFVPPELVAMRQATGEPSLYLPKYSDLAFEFKLQGARTRAPDILVLGPSRANQWRSAMFSASFYNAAHATYRLLDYQAFLERMGDRVPKVIILSLDAYDFTQAWSDEYSWVTEDRGLLSQPIAAGIVEGLTKELISHPSTLLKPQVDPVYGVPAIGLSAGEYGTGFRIDGSIQYGPQIEGDFSGSLSMDAALARVSTGSAPFQSANSLDPAEFETLAKFAKLATDKGIFLVGVTMPYAPQVLSALELSPGHQAWRDFRTARTREWFATHDIHYFDFSELSSFGGSTNEFVDPIHPSEPAYVRILLKMMEDKEVGAMLHAAPSDVLEAALSSATKMEAFRNRF